MIALRSGLDEWEMCAFFYGCHVKNMTSQCGKGNIHMEYFVGKVSAQTCYVVSIFEGSQGREELFDGIFDVRASHIITHGQEHVYDVGLVQCRLRRQLKISEYVCFGKGASYAKTHIYYFRGQHGERGYRKNKGGMGEAFEHAFVQQLEGSVGQGTIFDEDDKFGVVDVFIFDDLLHELHMWMCHGHFDVFVREPVYNIFVFCVGLDILHIDPEKVIHEAMENGCRVPKETNEIHICDYRGLVKYLLCAIVEEEGERGLQVI